jgi:hypothetical protein
MMKKIILGLILSAFILAACGSKYPTPEMLYGVWESDQGTITFREFISSDNLDLRYIGGRDQHGVVTIDPENKDSYEGAWWLNEKGMLMISFLDDSIEIPGLGTSVSTGNMYGIDELTEDTLIIWLITGGERYLQTYHRQ